MTDPNYANYQGSQTYAPRSVPGQPYQAPIVNSPSAPPAGGGNGNTGGGTASPPNPNDRGDWQNIKNGIAPVGAPSYNVDIQPAIDSLQAGIPDYQSSEAAQEQNINASKATQQAQATQGFNAQTQTLGNAQDQARRQAAEILQGIQGRYGGSTGEGSFASAQLGGQAIQTQAGLSQKIAQVQDVARLAQQDIEEKSTAQINSAKQWLSDTLQQIRNNVSTLQSHKADLAYAAMNQYQQYLEQIQLSKQNLVSSLAQQQQAAQLGLYGSLNKGQGIVGNPQSYLSALGLQGMGQVQQPVGGGQSAATPANNQDYIQQLLMQQQQPNQNYG